ncbi:MAG TPA: hypothetical protein VF792_11725 [Ktedonobacterales bacterium]
MMGVNPWDQTAPMGPKQHGKPAPHQPSAAAHWPTPQAPEPVLAEPETGTLPVLQRRWVAALILYLLAPIIAEVLTGATPPMDFLNPFPLVFFTAMYGSGALLARELVRRRGLGWWSLILLGAAYGALEEGVVVTSWQNPYWPDAAYLHGYGTVLGVNWYWALGLTIFHAIVSITLPITLVEAAFPSLAPLPWLGKRTYRLLWVWLTIASVAGLVSFGFLQFRDHGYHLPLIGWFLALVVTVALAWVGTHPLRRIWRTQSDNSNPPVVSRRHAPGLGALRFAGFALTLLFFAAFWGAPHIFQRPELGALAVIAALAVAIALVGRWSHRLDWSPRRRLALLSGVALFFAALAPVIEYYLKPAGKDVSGMTLLAIALVVGLVWLAHSARVAEQRRLGRR